MTVTSPFTVTGAGLASDQPLVVRVLDATGYEIGLGGGIVNGPLGEDRRVYRHDQLHCADHTQQGRVQVYSISPGDGAIEHLNVGCGDVDRNRAGPDNRAGEGAGIEAQDYETLALLMADPWDLSLLYSYEGLSLSAENAIDGLRKTYLGREQGLLEPVGGCGQAAWRPGRLFPLT